MTQLNQPKTTSDLYEWLNYLGSLHVSAIDMGLSRVLPVAKHLGLIQINQTTDKKPTVFTVAGTNGKGSTTASISAISEKAGYQTGLYQSPHILNFNERIQINNKPIDDVVLINAFKRVDDARILLKESLSFFEATTLAAFLIFKEADCQVWVLEIGLGGRLDVVNIIDPDVAVITNIGIDHIDWLGSDKEKIGYEKAGILRKQIPCIFASTDMPASVWKKAAEMHNDVYAYSVDYAFSEPQAQSATWLYSNQAITMQLPLPSLALENVSAGITAILASNLTVKQQHIAEALKSINLMGRFYQQQLAMPNSVDKKVTTIFDALHNPDGARFLLKNLLPKLLQQQPARLHIVFSMLADKDIATVIQLLNDAIYQVNWQVTWHIAPLTVARASDIELLEQQLEQANIDKKSVKTYKNIQKATIGAYQTAHESDKMLVCGSFHTIADALSITDGVWQSLF